jgi:CRISPR-associated exonuclease Cas4
MLWLPLILIFLALLVLWLSRRQQKKTGLPEGRVVYADMGKWQPNSQALYDPKLDLTGKPDYLIYQDNFPIPVEVKTGRTPSKPYDSHVFQLAAYCYLVEAVTGKRPPYGILNYPDQTFEIKYTENLRQSLLDLLGDLRIKERSRAAVPRSHDHAARCSHCGFRSICDERLT